MTVSWPSGEGIAIGLLAGGGVAVSFFFWVALSRYSKSRTVRLGRPTLCKTFIVSFSKLNLLGWVGLGRLFLFSWSSLLILDY